VGITYRRLDHWTRTGIVTPSLRAARGAGSQRRYSFADLGELRTIKQLVDAGIELRRVRRALAALRTQGTTLAETTLVSDGRTIYACHSADDVVDVLRKGQAVFAVAADVVVEQLRGELGALHPVSDPTAPAAELG
jgi:DNA-binding transcriptional MerR regulator